MDIRKFLLKQETPTYNAYYNGKMSYALHGKSWSKYVDEAFPDLKDMYTSENIYKDVIDLYAQNLIPVPVELKGFSNVLVPLLSRGECPVVVDSGGTPHFPEHFEMISDGRMTVAAIFTRSLEHMKDYVTFVWSDGKSEVWSKDVPDDMSPPDREGYEAPDEGTVETGNVLLRMSLDDKGFGPALAALQDRTNHSIIDQTVIAEMYARPFWYLLNVEIPPHNPYLPKATENNDLLKEQKQGDAAGRVFTTSSDGPFGQLDPPTISDMIGYHDSIISKVSQSTGIPEFFFKPGGQVPSGVALKVLSRRFNNKIARIRDNIETQLMELVTLLKIQPLEGETEIRLWPSSDDLLQDAIDSHGINLKTMGYPLAYVAEVVTPGVDLNDYMDDGFEESRPESVSKIAQQVYLATKGGAVLTPEESRNLLRDAGAELGEDDLLTEEEEPPVVEETPEVEEVEEVVIPEEKA